MRLLLLLLALFACTVSAQATIDPDADQIGIYFDLEANQTNLDVAANPTAAISAYVIITNPTAAVVRGIEFSWCRETVAGASGLLLPPTMDWYGNFADTAELFDWCTDGRRINFFDPLPFVGSNVPVVRLSFYAVGDVPETFFYLGPYVGLFGPEPGPEDLPRYLDGDFEYHTLGVSSGDWSLPVATLNSDLQIVGTENLSLDAVKSLYR